MLQKLTTLLMAYVMSGIATLKDAYGAFKDKVVRVARGESVFIDSGYYSLATPQLPTGLQADDRGQLGFQTVIAASVVVIAVMLVVIVVDQFDQALGTPDSNELDNASNDVLAGFADMTSLIGPLLIVAIAVVIISLIRRAN